MEGNRDDYLGLMRSMEGEGVGEKGERSERVRVQSKRKEVKEAGD